MTPDEHLLLITVLAKQSQLIKTLVDMLKSRGIVTGDDVRAFQFAASADAASSVVLFEREKAAYLRLAKELGIQTGLENASPLSSDPDP